MNIFSLPSMFTIFCGIFFGASLGLFAYGTDTWISVGIGCGLGACVALSEFSPVFD